MPSIQFKSKGTFKVCSSHTKTGTRTISIGITDFTDFTRRKDRRNTVTTIVSSRIITLIGITKVDFTC